MTSQSTMPRSVYAGKLREFPDFAVTDREAFTRHGRWRAFFRDRIGERFDDRIIFEIGCADAAFLSKIAAKHPDTAFVGLDWKCKALYEAAARVSSLNLRNVALVRGRGQDISKLFGANEIDEIWIFHPDPCDTDIELKNRLITETFLIDVHRTLRQRESLLCMKTDHLGYYQSLLALTSNGPIRERFNVGMNSMNYWNDQAAQQHASAPLFSGEITAYENRFMKKRHPIFYCEVRKA